ncbi:MAG: TatD family hydrolase [Candidatus Zixiibacteriota bacterium]|nr:MAG: TatD family hydrolase [candidate division Zixibacteria bacterium]
MLIDAHAHLNRYDALTDKATGDIENYKIFTISNSMDPASYRANLEIGEKCKYVLPTFGIHPWVAHEYQRNLIEFDEYIEKSPLLGELGLDYHYVNDSSFFPAQRKVFEYFIVRAAEQNKIVNLHTKGAEEDILRLLGSHNIKRAIIHWYSGPVKFMMKLLERGYYFTVGVEILFTEHIRKIARMIPDDLLLSETDNPGGYEWLAGTPGMPGVLQEVVLELARMRKLEYEECENMIQRNFERLIGGDDRVNDFYLKAKDRDERKTG